MFAGILLASSLISQNNLLIGGRNALQKAAFLGPSGCHSMVRAFVAAMDSLTQGWVTCCSLHWPKQLR